MFKFAILVTLAVASYGANIPGKKAPEIQQYIIGGTEIDITQAPYAASMFSDGRFICGATIVSPTMIVTSAICAIGQSVEKMTFRVGSTNLNEGGVVVKAKNSWAHPKFRLKTSDFDIAVIELQEPLELSEKIQPIKLATEKPADGAMAEACGWGLVSQNGAVAQILNSVAIPIINSDDCMLSVGWFKPITSRKICAVGNGKGACVADGPLVYNGRLVGVLSSLTGCGKEGSPTVFTNIAHHDITAFIREHAKI